MSDASLADALEASFCAAAALMDGLYNRKLEQTFGVHCRRNPIPDDLSHASIGKMLSWILTEKIALRISITQLRAPFVGVLSFFDNTWFNLELSELSDSEMCLVMFLCRTASVSFASASRYTTLSYESFIPNAELERQLNRVDIAKRVCAILLRRAAPHNFHDMHDMLLRAANALFSSPYVDLPQSWKSELSHYLEDEIVAEYLNSQAS